MTRRRHGSASIWTHVIASLACGLSIWAIVLTLVPRFTDPAASLTTSVSIASSVVLLGAAVYGLGTWRKQEWHRARHEIALRAIEAALEALEKLNYSRTVLTDQRETFRGAMAREEPWEPEDKERLIQDIREVNVALKHLRTASHLTRLHLDEKASTAMQAFDSAFEHGFPNDGWDGQIRARDVRRVYNALPGR